jgi:hypothetical protein
MGYHDIMTTRLDAVYLSIIAALGLELGCATPPPDEMGDDGESGNTLDASTSGNETSAGDGDGDGDGDPPPPFDCENPTPIMQAGTEMPSGFVQCANGFIHHAEAVECVTPQGMDHPDCANFGGTCQTNADCMLNPYGSCQMEGFDGFCSCNYGCVTDDDCQDGEVCVCAGVIGPYAQCIPGECTTGEDCAGELCGLSTHHDVCSDSHEMACTTATDECHVDADCEPAPCPDVPEGGPEMQYCEGFGGQGFSCQPSPFCDGVCGRPLLVGGHARVADAIEREDWCRASSIDALDGDTRERLADHWAQIGRFEHASVASFARFATHLLKLGAPPRLLRETTQAMADEIEHARLAFGLASAYARSSIGAGALDVRGSIEPELDRYAIVEALIDEACIGETLAAIEAYEAAAHAVDPAVVEVLERIAADELRHAQLGWRSLRWMLDVGDERLRGFALARLDAVLREVMHATVEDGVPASLREHGLLDDELRTHVRRRSASELIGPCVAALRSAHQRAAMVSC